MFGRQQSETDLTRREGDVGMADFRGEVDLGRGEGIVRRYLDGKGPEAVCRQP